jgi:hypothetical protein
MSDFATSNFAVPGLMVPPPQAEPDYVHVAPDGTTMAKVFEQPRDAAPPRLHLVGEMTGGDIFFEDSSMERIYPKDLPNGRKGWFWILRSSNAVPPTASFLNVMDAATKSFGRLPIRRTRTLPFAAVFTAEELAAIIGDESGKYMLATEDGFVLATE